MSSLIANEAVQAFLSSVTETTEILDAKGRVLGVYRPTRSRTVAEREALARKLFDLEEAERVSAARCQGQTIDEVWQGIQALETKE